MTTNELLLDGFSRVKGTVHSVLKGLPEEVLTWRAGENANTIAWLVWHLARVQDAQVAALTKSDDLWNRAGWYEKFGLPFDKDASGYGQSSDEVAQVKASTESLLGYYDAAHKQTVEYVKGLTDADLDEVIDTRWDPPVTRGVRLVSILDDDMQHAGQAAYVRCLFEDKQ